MTENPIHNEIDLESDDLIVNEHPFEEITEEDLECIVCLDLIEDYATLYKNTLCKCEYTAHDKCLYKWLKQEKSCPTCRKELSDEIVNRYQERISDYQRERNLQIQNNANECGKMCFMCCVFFCVVTGFAIIYSPHSQ